MMRSPHRKKISIPQGIYRSADQVLEKICEGVYNFRKQQTWPIEWSVSRHSQLLRIRPAAANRDRSNEKNQDEEVGLITADTNTSEDESVSNDNDKTIRLVSLDLKNNRR